MRQVNTLKKRPYIENRQLRHPKVKYFIAYEGVVTEPQYFDGVQRYADRLHINAMFEIHSLNRSTIDEGRSNPYTGCLPQFQQALQEYREGKMSVDTLADHTVDWAVENYLIKGKNNTSGLKRLKKSILERLQKAGYQIDMLLDESALDVAGECAYQNLMDIVALKNLDAKLKSYLAHIHSQCETFSSNDKACLVIDRDKESFTNQQYIHVLSECMKNGISLYVSNPCFEFWILLHFTDGKEFDAKRLADSPEYLTKCLGTVFPEYAKNSIHFEELLPRITQAIKNEKQYAEDLNALQTELGTNVGQLIYELMNNNATHQATH